MRRPAVPRGECTVARAVLAYRDAFDALALQPSRDLCPSEFNFGTDVRHTLLRLVDG
jgi:hypothetical protein